jgi:Type-A lantibiotic
MAKEMKKTGIFIQTATDNELEMLIGGKGAGYVKTLTKDCPNVVSQVCGSLGGWISACKNC